MAAPRLRKCQSPREYESVIDDFHTQGYEAINRGQNSVLLRKKTWGSLLGHALLFFLTVWFTMGIGNLVYALVAHFTAEKILVQLEVAMYEPPPANPQQAAAQRPVQY